MIATLFILREANGIEYDVPTEIMTRGGEIVATVSEDVPEKHWTTRFGGLELEHTGDFVFEEGEEIDLTDEEYEEAEEMLARLKEDFDREVRNIISGGRAERRTE